MILIKMKKLLTIFVSLSLSLFLSNNAGIAFLQADAQNNASLSELQNTNENLTSAEEKNYILIFGQRTVGNIDNSTKIVSSIIGHNSLKIEEEFLEEISLAPSQQLEEQINTIVNDGINGSSYNGISLTTQQGVSVSVNCIFTGDRVIWYVYPTP